MTFSSAEEKKIIEQKLKYGYSNKRNTFCIQSIGKLYNSLYRMGQSFTLDANSSKASSQKKVIRT